MVVNVAVPFANVPVPSEVVPLKKVTIPLGTPAVEVTGAVKTMLAPTEIDADARLNVVAVGIAVTVAVTGKLVRSSIIRVTDILRRQAMRAWSIENRGQRSIDGRPGSSRTDSRRAEHARPIKKIHNSGRRSNR
jgi:hypothetical protein